MALKLLLSPLNLAEPYFVFVAASLSVMAEVAEYTAYKARAGQLGESVVTHMAAEAGRKTSGFFKISYKL